MKRIESLALCHIEPFKRKWIKLLKRHDNQTIGGRSNTLEIKCVFHWSSFTSARLESGCLFELKDNHLKNLDNKSHLYFRWTNTMINDRRGVHLYRSPRKFSGLLAEIKLSARLVGSDWCQRSRFPAVCRLVSLAPFVVGGRVTRTNVFLSFLMVFWRATDLSRADQTGCPGTSSRFTRVWRSFNDGIVCVRRDALSSVSDKCWKHLFFHSSAALFDFKYTKNSEIFL